MNAIVPAGTNLARVYSGVKRARTATGYVRRYGPTAVRAARVIARAYRRRSRRRRAPGRRVVSGKQGSTRARTTISNNYIVFNAYQLQVTPVEFGNMGPQYGDRTGHSIRMTGLKYCFDFQNEGINPMVVHFAIVQLREENDPIGSYNWEKDFFRDYESATTRAVDFPSGSTFSFKYNCWKLNPSKFQILTHKKKTLIGRSRGAGETKGESTTGRLHFRWHINRYMKVNKHMSFKDAQDITPTKPIFYLKWCYPLVEDDSPGNGVSWAYMSKPVWRNALN